VKNTVDLPDQDSAHQAETIRTQCFYARQHVVLSAS